MIDKIELIKHYDKCAENIEKWKKRNSYYHGYIKKILKFMVLEDSDVIVINCRDGSLLSPLQPKSALGVDISSKMIEIAKKNYSGKNIDYICADIEKDKIPLNKKYDYIILNGTLGEINDIQKFFNRISRFCHNNTRVIIIQYNPLWETVLKIAEKLKLKMPEKISNWLSPEDIENFLEITGYQVIKRNFFLLFPKRILVLSGLVNKFFAKLPIIRRLNLVMF